jgi:hypothetical protein
MSTKENLFGDQLKKKREAEEKEKAKQYRWRSTENAENAKQYQWTGFNFQDNFKTKDSFNSFHYNLWDELLERLFNTFNILNSHFSLSIPEDSFQFLGLTSEASLDDINQSYRTMSLKFHPDKGGSQESFIKLTEAKNKCTMYAQNKV